MDPREMEGGRETTKGKREGEREEREKEREREGERLRLATSLYLCHKF